METVLRLLCEGTSDRVENVALVANDRCATIEEQRNGVRVIRVAAVAKIGAVAVCPTLPFWLARQSADIIVIHEPNPMALVAYFLVRPGGRLIVWFHSEIIRPRWRYRLFYRPFLRFALSCAAKIVVASPTLAASADQLQDFQQKCTVIPYGFDARRRDPSPAVLQRAAALRQQYEPPIVLFVGRMVPYKGLEVLLEALGGLQATAILVGDGPVRPSLERRVQELGIAKQVAFAGEVREEELDALYHACDLFVLPSVSRQEAFGVVQLEAMACGKPVVSTALPTGVPWVNQDQRTGLIVAPCDAVALREALARLISNPELRAAMGKSGRQRALSEFTTERMNDRVVALYRDVCGTDSDERVAAPGEADVGHVA